MDICALGLTALLTSHSGPTLQSVIGSSDNIFFVPSYIKMFQFPTGALHLPSSTIALRCLRMRAILLNRRFFAGLEHHVACARSTLMSTNPCLLLSYWAR